MKIEIRLFLALLLLVCSWAQDMDQQPETGVEAETEALSVEAGEQPEALLPEALLPEAEAEAEAEAEVVLLSVDELKKMPVSRHH